MAQENEKKTERTSAGGDPRGSQSSSQRHFFDEWVDRRLKTMHDAVLEEKIPDDMLRMLLGDARVERDNPERGTSDDANRPRPEGKPDPGHRRCH